MLSDPCTKAFEAAGLTPPKKLLEKGLLVGPASLLADPSAENLQYMGITEAARSRDAGIYGSETVKAVTVRDHPGYLADTVDGRPRIFLNASAFGAGLGDYLRHEFIHAGGADARENPWGSDLYYLGYTDTTVTIGGGRLGATVPVKTGTTEQDILNACR